MDLTRTSGPERRWIGLAAILAGLGITISVLGAGAVARSQAGEERRAFETSSAEVASTLELAIERIEDLAVAAGAHVVGHPEVSDDDFATWMRDIRAFDRFAELESMGFMVEVAFDDLDAYATDVADADNPQPFVVIPPGERPLYLFNRLAEARDPQEVSPPGLDMYELGTRDRLWATRDLGTLSYEPVPIDDVTWLGVQMAVYEGGAVPATVADRRERFSGWLGILVDPGAVIDRALQGSPVTVVRLDYNSEISEASFVQGRPPAAATTSRKDFGNGWVATTFRPQIASGVFDRGEAIGLLLAGVGLSVLVGAMIIVLATGRARAERLVRSKTDELRHRALHDSLTGLPNRTLLMDRLEHLVARGRRTGSRGAVLFLDLDGFKAINDTHGHAAGDQLLRSVANRLTTALREADTIARLGGDEFVILLDDTSMAANPEMVADRILAVLRQPFELDAAERPVRVSASIGITAGDRSTGSDLLRDADIALYQSKDAGRDRYSIFQPEMEAAIHDGLELDLDLDSALARDEFRLLYQPIYNLEDLTLLSVEALLRWEHPTRGQLAPDTFLPQLERNGHIVDVGQWVLSEACSQMAAWHARGSVLSVSVNVSARQFESDSIIEHVREALASSGLPPSCLIIEITESAVMRDVVASGARLAQLKDLGVHVAIDDFGTGYSSLGYLQHFPVDSLKIDRSFIDAMCGSAESEAIVRTIVQLGHDLGLKTLAEGVETTAQVDQLRGEHVDEAQGFLLARPLDAEALEAILLLPERALT